MDCPMCHSRMTPGEITLEGTWVDIVSGGGGFSEVRFQAEGREPVTIMAHAEVKPALTCAACNFFMILNDPEFTETACLICQAIMPGGVSRCPECGWTYQAGEE
jgi:RNA polymerase subunit RPABC4/transcription elongation factor Spt4